jgi:hypothetical protein
MSAGGVVGSTIVVIEKHKTCFENRLPNTLLTEKVCNFHLS